MAIVGRVLLGAFFVFAGLGKFMDMAGTASYMEAYGVPMAGVLAPVAAIFLVVAGGALIAGFQKCLAALLLGLFTILVTVIFHTDFSDQAQMIMFMKNVAIVGALLLLVGSCKGSCGSKMCKTCSMRDGNSDSETIMSEGHSAGDGHEHGDR